MKILLTADLHIGSALSSLPPEKAKERRGELISTFCRICSYAEESKAAAVIIAGDLFDTGRVPRKTVRYVTDEISSHPSVAFYYLTGNHDDAYKESSDIPANLYTFGRDWSYFRIGNVIIAGRNEVESSMYGSLALDPEDFNVVVLHGQESSSRTLSEGVISYPLLAGKNVDLLALGHLHYYHGAVIDRRGRAVYPGCPEGRGFDECGEKGFVLIDTEKPAGENTVFVPYALRVMREIRVTLDREDLTLTDIEKKVNASLKGIPGSDMVKLIFEGEVSPDCEKDISFIESRLSERFFYAKCKDCTGLYVDPDRYKNDPSLKGELMRTLADTVSDPELLRDAALTALAALRGEDVE